MVNVGLGHAELSSTHSNGRVQEERVRVFHCSKHNWNSNSFFLAGEKRLGLIQIMFNLIVEK